MLSAVLITATLAFGQNQPSKPLTPSPVPRSNRSSSTNQNQFIAGDPEQKHSAVNDSSPATFRASAPTVISTTGKNF